MYQGDDEEFSINGISFPVKDIQVYNRIIVPGLPDNSKTGVRRSAFTLSAVELRSIFEPVLVEILALIKGQVRATKPTIPRAVLLVGGFGQSTYLREAISAAVAPSGIEVLQTANGLVKCTDNMVQYSANYG